MRSRGSLISSFWVALILSTSSSSLGHFNSDGIVLLEFKDSIFDPSGILSSWNLEYHHCSWEGVSCDAKSSVRSLRITGGGGFRGNPSTLSKFGISRSDLLSFHAQRSSRNINGTLVGKLSSTLFLLAELRVLSLPFHELSGEIPVEIRNLRKLEIIDLEGNSLSGRLPAAIFCSRNLRVLNLAGNQIHGNVPLNLWKLSKNCLQGPTPFHMFRPKNLHYFFLNGDSFTESSSSSIQASSKCSGKRRTLLSYQEEEEEMEEDEEKKTMATVDDDGKNTVSVFDGDGKKTRLSSIAITSIISSSIIVSLLILLAFLFVYTRKMTSKSRSQFSGPKEITMFSETGVPLTFDTVVRATGNFSTSFCIGHGGFGSTYKVEISEGVFLAVKRLSVGKFPQGVKQFHAEIETLGRTRHENLVTLVGYHASRTEMFLIYNHLSGGNLERFIEERQATRATPKILRKIALGVARAVSFLHYDCVPRILHRDIKPSNVLLDAELNAYLSDFGLSRLLRNSETHVTTGVAGTFGYVAPEYATTCRVSYKSDVYSYGVVLLELISNKKLLDPSFSSKGNGFNIVSWARVLSRDGCAEDAFPPWLWLIGSRDWLVAALNLAIACTAENLVARPTMKQVVHILKDLQCADDDETLT